MTFLVYEAISSANISVTIIGITILYLFHLRYQSYSENGQPSFVVSRRSTAVPSVIIHLQFHFLILGLSLKHYSRSCLNLSQDNEHPNNDNQKTAVSKID